MECTKPSPERLKYRRYLPADVNLCHWDALSPYLDELQNREISSAQDLEEFILDYSGLASALQEEYARIQLATSRYTNDENAKKLFRHFSETIMSRIPGRYEILDNRFLDSPYLKDLDSSRYGQLIKLKRNEKQLYREENVPLSIKDSQLGEQYSAIAGGLSVEFGGKQINLTQLGSFQKSQDRAVRERAWRAGYECRKNVVDDIDHIYDQMLTLRHTMARNAGYDNFRDYRHMVLSRFDYTPDDCLRYHEMVEKYAVPIVNARREVRRKKLGLEKLRPWDMSVDPDGNEPLKPFETEEELIRLCERVMDRVYPNLGDHLRKLNEFGNLDLMTRQHKSPVGFNMPLDETRVSFIFMNAQGLHFDLMVLLHESGHAVETRACASESILNYRHTPQEWGECASQGMEMLGIRHLDEVYSDPADVKRCILEKLEDTLRTITSSAMIDAFQQWVYTHPGHTPRERRQKWVEVSHRFGNTVDFTGIEESREIGWQSIPHLFIVPFYYIEYGIAQLAAIQVLRNSRNNEHAFFEKWFKAMEYGYSKPIPELYEAAGLKFQLYGEFAGELIQFVASEIERVEKW